MIARPYPPLRLGRKEKEEGLISLQMAPAGFIGRRVRGVDYLHTAILGSKGVTRLRPPDSL